MKDRILYIVIHILLYWNLEGVYVLWEFIGFGFEFSSIKFDSLRLAHSSMGSLSFILLTLWIFMVAATPLTPSTRLISCTLSGNCSLSLDPVQDDFEADSCCQCLNMDLVYGTTVFTDEDIRIVPGIDVDNFRPSVAAGPSHCQLNATETTIAVSVDTCEYGAQSSTTVPPFHIEPQIGDIYAGFKPVTVCGDMQYGPQYPQFPGYDSLVNWEAAKNKVVHDVKRYSQPL